MEYIILWSSAGILFLILEFFTATTYGLGLAIGSFMAAIYVWLVGIEDLDIWQLLIFGIVSLGLNLLFPKIFKRSSTPLRIGAEAYIGKTTHLFKNNESWKVKCDGVEYLADASDRSWFRIGKEVKVVGHEGTTLIVEKTQND